MVAKSSFTVLILLSLLSVIGRSVSERLPESKDDLELVYKPCILNNINCPADGSLDYDSYAEDVRYKLNFKPPEECKCDLDDEWCARRCYYAYTLSSDINTKTDKLTDPTEIAAVKSQVTAEVERHYKPCVLKTGGKCQFSFLDYGHISKTVKNNVNHFTLPKACECEKDKESCIRQCYYAQIREKFYSN